MKVLLPFTVFLAIAPELQPKEVALIWDAQANSAVEAAVAVPPADFSVDLVLNMCRAFLARNQRRSLIRYLVVTDADEAKKSLRGLGVTDWDFQMWRRAYLASSGSPQLATAEMIRIGNMVSVRLRLADGALTTRGIAGHNPMIQRFQGHDIKIVEVTLGWQGDPANVFVETSKPFTISEAEALSRFIRAETKGTNLIVHIENGWWFAGEPKYPIVNRFIPYSAPPTFDEFKHHTRFYCEDGSGRCMQIGPARN